jgi:hypothetical protein
MDTRQRRWTVSDLPACPKCGSAPTILDNLVMGIQNDVAIRCPTEACHSHTGWLPMRAATLAWYEICGLLNLKLVPCNLEPEITPEEIEIGLKVILDHEERAGLHQRRWERLAIKPSACPICGAEARMRVNVAFDDLYAIDCTECPAHVEAGTEVGAMRLWGCGD